MARTNDVESTMPVERSFRSAPAQNTGGVCVEHDHTGTLRSAVVERAMQVGEQLLGRGRCGWRGSRA